MAKYNEQFDFTCKVDRFKHIHRAFVYGDDCLIVYKDSCTKDILFANVRTTDVKKYIEEGFYKVI